MGKQRVQTFKEKYLDELASNTPILYEGREGSNECTVLFYLNSRYLKVGEKHILFQEGSVEPRVVINYTMGWKFRLPNHPGYGKTPQPIRLGEQYNIEAYTEDDLKKDKWRFGKDDVLTRMREIGVLEARIEFLMKFMR
jgi:hypothetical protein